MRVPAAGPVSVVIEVGKRFATLADAHDDGLGQRFAERLRAGMDATCRRLGIAPSPRPDVRASAEKEAVRVRLNGRVRRCPDSVAHEVSEHFLRDEPGPPPGASAWWQEIACHLGGDDPDRACAAVDALAAVAGRILDEAPDELIGAEHATGLLDPAAAGETLPPARLAGVLRTAAALGASLADRPRVMHTIAEAVARDLDDPDVAELVVSRLRSRWVRIEASPEYLERVTGLLVEDVVAVHDPALPWRTQEHFGLMEEALFFELGVRAPQVHLAAVENLVGHQVRIAIGDAAPSLRVGLAPGHVLVSAPAEALSKRGVTAIPTVNPIDGAPCAIVTTGDGAAADMGYVWDPANYLVLLMASELRRQAHVLVDVDSVELELATLHEAFSTLVLAALERIPVGHLARVMRLLLREEIGIRNLRGILESLLAADLLDAVHRRDRVSDARYGAATARNGMRRYVTQKYFQAGVLRAHRLVADLESEIETLIDRERRPGDVAESELEARRERIRAGVGAALALPGGVRPVIVTRADIRHRLRSLMADARPDLAVLADEELPPGTAIHLLGTISLA